MIHAQVACKTAHLPQRRADLFEGLFKRHVLGNVIGPDLDAGRSDIRGEFRVFLGSIDILLQLVGVRRMVFEGTSEAGELDGGVLDAFANVLPFGG
jgi:hypothetical protein